MARPPIYSPAKAADKMSMRWWLPTPAGKVRSFLVSVEDGSKAARKFWRIASVANPFDDRGRLVRASLGNGVSKDHVLDSISSRAFVW